MQTIMRQVCRFSLVGVLSFGIDYGLLYLMTEKLGLYYLLSAAISFSAATVFNYIYSMKYVFQGREGLTGAGRFLIFLLLSVCGLCMNSLFMRFGVEAMSMHVMAAKLWACVVVSAFNFITRKLCLEQCSWKKNSLRGPFPG